MSGQPFQGPDDYQRSLAARCVVKSLLQNLDYLGVQTGAQRRACMRMHAINEMAIIFVL